MPSSHWLFAIAEYVKAAQILKDKDSPIKLAKVEGPEESDLLEKMHVTGYPTLFFYRDGEPIKYSGNDCECSDSEKKTLQKLATFLHFSGGRMAAEIAQWVEKKTGPAGRFSHNLWLAIKSIWR